jgi:predicted ATPase/class 3 adenylate cyclase
LEATLDTLPTGTITFLLTDIEGSTRLWDQDAPSMQKAVARQQTIIAELVQQHAGRLPKAQGEGDSVLAVFPRASDAVAATLEIQRSLNSEVWPTNTPIRIRIALHTGEAELREGDYYGQTVNRCARMRAIAHGGQTLLSKATAELVRDQLPEGASLEDAGVHQLRDLTVPEHVFQLCHPDLPADFPPLRSVEGASHNLPIQLTSFIGRTNEIAEVKKLIANTRLLTLTGPGGFGKTRLALEVAGDLVDEYSDGVWVVELEYQKDPSLVAQSVASVLGVREEPGRELMETLADHSRSKAMLLVLDNCEHVVGASATLAGELLRLSPSLKILATSRESLGVSGETTWMVPPLSLPDPKVSPQGLEGLAEFESARLFVDRAFFAKPDFTLAHSDAPTVAAICRSLDGIPLAIELAASWVKVLPVHEINKRLKDRLRMLAGGARTAATRKQTIRASIDWSYDLLTEEEKALLIRLSVFHGGFTLEAAEGICSGASVAEGDVLETLSRLVDKSLVLAEERDGDVRYRLLEVVREYAAELLSASKADTSFRNKHLDWFTSFAETTEKLLYGPQQLEWYRKLDDEHDNFRAALEWTETARLSDAGLRLAGALGNFWFVRGYWSEGRRRLERALAECADASPETRATGLYWAGGLALGLGDYEVARERFEEALQLRREIGDQSGIGTVLNALGNMTAVQGDLASAKSFFEEGLLILREIGDKSGLLTTLSHLAYLAQTEGDLQPARSLVQEALSLARELGGERGIAGALFFLGTIALGEGEYADAQGHFEEALEIHRRLGDTPRVAFCLAMLGDIAYEQGNLDDAKQLLEDATILGREVGEKQILPDALEHLATVARSRGDYSGASTLYEEALEIARELNDRKRSIQVLIGQAGLAWAQGDLSRAQSLIDESLALARDSSRTDETADSLQSLGDFYWAQDEHAKAEGLYREALEINLKQERQVALTGSLERVAASAAFAGQHARAARLLAAASRKREETGWPIYAEERPRYEATVRAIRDVLSADEFKRASEDGGAMTLEEAAELALSS